MAFRQRVWVAPSIRSRRGFRAGEALRSPSGADDSRVDTRRPPYANARAARGSCRRARLARGLPRSAHHSNSAYQVDQIVTLTGTVKEWRWMNPHTWLYLTVKGEDGKAQEWAVEGRPPGILGRAGWNSTILMPGERVTVHASPAKNGDPEGIIARVTKADGTVLGNAPNFNREATAAARAPRRRARRRRRQAELRGRLLLCAARRRRSPRRRAGRTSRCRRRRARRRRPTARRAAAPTRRS